MPVDLSLGGLARRFRDDLRSGFWPLLGYDLFFKLLAAAALTPIFAWGATRILQTRGKLSIGNEDIVAFLYSPIGLAWLLAVGATALAIAFAEHGGMVLIMQGAHHGRIWTGTAALWAISRRLGRLLLLAGLHVVAHLLRLAPFVLAAGIVYKLLLSEYDLNYLVTETPPVFWLAVALVALLAVGVLLVNGGLYVRWSLSLPLFLCEGLVPREAIRKSQRLVRSQARQVRRPVLVGLAALVLLPLALGGVFQAMGWLFFRLLPNQTSLLVPAIVVFMAASLAASVLAIFMGTAANSSVMLGVFELLREPSSDESPAESAAAPQHQQAAGRAVWGGVALALLAALVFSAVTLSRFDLEDQVEITAHRGSSAAAPENTLSAIAQAIEDGADYAEIDVQETADGELVVFHDADFLRLTGVATKIWDMPLEELRKLDVGSWFDPRFAGERVPTLVEAIALSRGRIKLNVELKINAREQQLPERVVEILHREAFADQVLITSLNQQALQRVRQLDPEIRLGYIFAEAIGGVTRLEVEALSVATRKADRLFILTAQKSGKQVHVWTVNDRRQMAHFIDLGVDNIITDLPAELKALLEERAELSEQERLLLRVKSWLWG